MFITFVCPNCKEKYKIELTAANKEIERLKIELSKYYSKSGDSLESLKSIFGMYK